VTSVARVFDLGMAALFALAALVQLNDPDPVRWVAIYVAACGLSMMAAGRPSVLRAATAAVGAIALAWAGLIMFHGPGASSYGHMFDEWEMKSVAVEEAREASGLLIVAAWMVVLLLRSLRAPSAPARPIL
jgi:hypothetical protein